MSFLKNAAVCALALCLGMMGVPAASFAQVSVSDDTTYTTTSNGWTLKFTVDESEGSATISGAEATSSNKLVIPSSVTVDGTSYTVTAIGADAFNGVTGFKQVSLPSTMVTLGNRAFANSSITSISFPASVWSIGQNCFRNCTALASVVWEGDYSGYIDNYAFYGCAQISEVAIPALLGGGTTSFAIGTLAFQNCTSLTAVYYLPGRADYYIENGGSSGQGNQQMTPLNHYFPDGNVFNGCTALTTMVYYLAQAHTYHGGSGYPTASTSYFTIDFFTSETGFEDAISRCKSDASGNEYLFYDNSQALANVTYKSTTKLASILAGDTTGAFTGSATQGLVAASDAVPSATEVSGDSSAVWYVVSYDTTASDCTMLTSTSSTLSDYCYAYPVSSHDLSYAFIEGTSSYTHYEDVDIEPESVTVYTADGSVLDESEYTLHLYQLEYDATNETYYSYNSSTHPGTEVSVITEAGRYVYVACGNTEGYEDTVSATMTVTVTEYAYTPAFTSYTVGAAKNVANAHNAVSNSGAVATTNVLVDSSDWAAALVAAGVAGVGEGEVLLADSGSVDTTTKTALNLSQATELIVVESNKGTISDSTLSSISGSVSSLAQGDITSLPLSSTSSADEMALNVYQTLNSAWGSSGYGSVAIVATGTTAYDQTALAQIAYEAKAPVFFTNSAGSLSSETLAAIAAGGFSTVYVAGNTSAVSTECVTALSGATSAKVERILTSSSAFDNSVEAANLVLAQFGGSVANVVLADNTVTGQGAAACSFAGRLGGICLLVTGTADKKAAQDYVATLKLNSIETVWLLGCDSTVKSRISSLYTDEPTSTELASGDTIEAAGLLFTYNGSTLSFTSALDANIAGTISFTSLTYAGATYSVASFTYGSTAQTEAEEESSEVLLTQSIKLSTSSKTQKVKKLKKKARSFTVKVKRAKGSIVAKSSSKKVTAKVSGSKVKITVKKGTKKGTYKVKVYARAKGQYQKSATKTITVVVK